MPVRCTFAVSAANASGIDHAQINKNNARNLDTTVFALTRKLQDRQIEILSVIDLFAIGIGFFARNHSCPSKSARESVFHFFVDRPSDNARSSRSQIFRKSITTRSFRPR
jgi:hypothetical protein